MTSKKLGIAFVATGIFIWLFGPFFEQFKDFTTVLLIVIGFIVIGIILIVKAIIEQKRKKHLKSS